MFTGIVEKTVPVSGVVDTAKFRRLWLYNSWPDVQCGQSVAVNGVCLTIAELGKDAIGFDVIHETLEKSNLGLLASGDEVNVERSMRVGDRIDGHFVQGHVDGKASLLDIKSNAEEWRLAIQAPEHLAKYLVPKGSVAVDGVSMTIATVRGQVFEIAIIPTTLKLTTLGRKPVGWPFNLEADIVSKTIVSWLEQREQQGPGISQKVV